MTRIQRAYYANDGRPVETADIVVPTARCEIVYEAQTSPGAKIRWPGVAPT